MSGEIPQFPDKKIVNRDTLWDKSKVVMEAKRTHWAETRAYQEHATVEFPDNSPITVVGIGDVHMGSIYSDTTLFERDMQLIQETPGMYAVFLSNLIDAAIPAQFPDSLLANGLRLDEQAEAMNDFIRRLDKEHKVLGMVRSPCHEGWSEKKAGIDVQKIIFMGTDIPMLENGGTLNLKFPSGKDFDLMLYHQFGRGYGSEANKNYAGWYQMRQVRRGVPDAIMIGHSHVGEVEHSFYGQPPNRKEVVLVRTGSFKGNVSGKLNAPNDVWQRDQSGRDGEPSGENITFFPEAGTMTPHLSPIQGAEYQMQHRANYLVESGGLKDRVEGLAMIAREEYNIEPPQQPKFTWSK